MRTPVSNSYDSVKELSQHCSGFGSLGSDLIAHILAVGNVGVFTFVQMSRVCKAGYIACRDYEDAVMAVTLRMNRGMRQSLFCGLFCLTQEQAVDCFNWKYRCHVDGGKVQRFWTRDAVYTVFGSAFGGLLGWKRRIALASGVSKKDGRISGCVVRRVRMELYESEFDDSHEWKMPSDIPGFW